VLAADSAVELVVLMVAVSAGVWVALSAVLLVAESVVVWVVVLVVL